MLGYSLLIDEREQSPQLWSREYVKKLGTIKTQKEVNSCKEWHKVPKGDNMGTRGSTEVNQGKTKVKG